MLKMSRIAGSMVLLLIALFVFLGCPTGSSPSEAIPPGGDGTLPPTGGGLYPPVDKGKTPTQLATEFANAWNKDGATNVSVANAVVTLEKDLTVVKTLTPAPAASMLRSVTVPEGSVEVVTQAIPAGVTLRVPGGKTLTIGKADQEVSFVTNGTISVAKDGDDKGTLLVLTSATLTVNSNATVTVAGTLAGDGIIKGVSSTSIVTILEGGEIDDEATLTIDTAGDLVLGEDVEIPGDVEVKGDGNVTGVSSFSRSENAGTYTLQSYNDGSNLVKLTSVEGEAAAAYYTVSDTDADLQALFKAIYTPNAPDSAVDVFHSGETGKTAIAYTSEISEAVLGLFQITIGSTADGDRIELTGTPPATTTATPNASATNLIVIDIGVPEGGNTSLPTFYIPVEDGLGTDDGDDDETDSYSHIRLRVNPGAHLVIEADNSEYISSGAGNSCPSGKFGGGSVEVMPGGKLRDGAYEGFPLGANAVILNWAGSSLAVGPESSFSTETSDYSSDRDEWYAGWLIGPMSDNPRIKWDDNNGYIEVRPGKLAISGKVTLQKVLGLIYSVWFDGGSNTMVTIDIGADGGTYNGMAGLFANDGGADLYNFYGTSGAKIRVKKDNVLHKAFLTAKGDAASDPSAVIFLKGNVEGGYAEIIASEGDESSLEVYPNTDAPNPINGYLNWTYNPDDSTDFTEVDLSSGT